MVPTTVRPRTSTTRAGPPASAIRATRERNVTRHSGIEVRPSGPGPGPTILRTVGIRSTEPTGYERIAGSVAIAGVAGRLRAQVQTMRSRHAARASLALDAVQSRRPRTVDTSGLPSQDVGVSDSRPADGEAHRPAPGFLAQSPVRFSRVAPMAHPGVLPVPPRGARPSPPSHLDESYAALTRRSASGKPADRAVERRVPTTLPTPATSARSVMLHRETVSTPPDRALPTAVGAAGTVVGRTSARGVTPGPALRLSTTHPLAGETRAVGIPTVAGASMVAPPRGVVGTGAERVGTAPAPGVTPGARGAGPSPAEVTRRRVGRTGPVMPSLRLGSPVATAPAPEVPGSRQAVPAAWSPGASSAFAPPTAWRRTGPPTALADVFTRVLGAHPPDPPEPLPGRFAPLALAVADSGPVSIRSGPAARRALTAVGKPAATIGRVVHLTARPDRSPRSAEIIAHELVHVRRPSSAVRFFDDERPSDEESLARHVGGLARALTSTQPAHIGDDRAWPPPVQGSAGLPVQGRIAFVPARRAPESIRRDTAEDAPTAPTARDGLASSLERIGSPLLQRLQEASTMPSTFGPETEEPQGGASSAFEHRGGSSVTNRGDRDEPSDGDTRGPYGEATAPLPEEEVERILDALERRVLADLERRGLRYDPGVF